MFPKISINLRIIAVKESGLPLYKTTKTTKIHTSLKARSRLAARNLTNHSKSFKNFLFDLF